MKRPVSRRSGRGSASAPSAEDSWQSASLDRTRRSIAEAIGDLEAATLEAHPGFRRGDPTPGDVRPALDKILLASRLRDSAFMIHAGGSSEEEANAAEFRELLDRAERAVSEARALTRAARASASKHERGENPRVSRARATHSAERPGTWESYFERVAESLKKLGVPRSAADEHAPLVRAAWAAAKPSRTTALTIKAYEEGDTQALAELRRPPGVSRKSHQARERSGDTRLRAKLDAVLGRGRK